MKCRRYARFGNESKRLGAFYNIIVFADSANFPENVGRKETRVCVVTNDGNADTGRVNSVYLPVRRRYAPERIEYVVVVVDITVVFKHGSRGRGTTATAADGVDDDRLRFRDNGRRDVREIRQGLVTDGRRRRRRLSTAARLMMMMMVVMLLLTVRHRPAVLYRWRYDHVVQEHLQRVNTREQRRFPGSGDKKARRVIKG